MPCVLAVLAASVIAPFGAYAATPDSARAATADLPTYVPGVAAWPSGKGFDIVYRTSAGNVAFRNLRDGVWSDPINLGGAIVGGPSITFAARNPRVYGRGTDGQLWERVRVGGTWSAWESLGGSTYSSPAVAADPATGRAWVIVRDTTADNRLRLRTLSGSWSDWQVVGGKHVDGPGAAFGGGRAAVVARGRDGAFWSRTITGTTWSGEQRAWVPGSPPGVPSSLRGKNVTAIPTTSKVAALTFDCAWSAVGVPSIRATLQRRNVPATFFMVGDFVRMFPVNANLLAGAGFRVGNHSDNHPDFTKIDDATARTEVTAARTAIFRGDGAEPRPLFRFPYGAYTSSDVTLVNGLGYVPIGWTVDSLGWKGTSGGQTAAKVAERVLAAAKPGMIVLMHVGANPDDGTILDADALPQIIQGLRDRGYSFVTLDALPR
jgi:peptidoglycan/xylan/chitin deacetylase (PgdA/CDA1 family)